MGATVVVALAITMGSTSAQSLDDGAANALVDGPRSGESNVDWDTSLGAAIVSTPRFTGSDRMRTLGLPNFSVRYRDWFFVDPIKGIGVERKVADGPTANVAFAIDLASRKRRDDPRIAGLRSIPESPAVRYGLDYAIGEAFVSTTATTRVGNHVGRGTLVETDLGYDVVASRRALVGIGANVKLVDLTYARHFFGVSSDEAAASRLPAYRAGGGLESVGAFVQAIVPLSDHWTLFGRAAEARLRGSAAASPVTVKRNQPFALATVSYIY